MIEDEARTINNTAAKLIAQACFAFGPENTGDAVAALAVALGTMFDMMTPIKTFYGTPDHFADCMRTIVLEVAEGARA